MTRHTIDPDDVSGPADWDPDLAPDGFAPDTASDGRSFHVAAWDGGMRDLAVDGAEDVYDLERGAPVALVYYSNSAQRPVVKQGEIGHFNATGTSATLRVRLDDGDARSVDAFGTVSNPDDRTLGEVLDVRLCRHPDVPDSADEVPTEDA